MKYGETHCGLDRKCLYCLLFFILSKKTQWNFLKTKTFDYFTKHHFRQMIFFPEEAKQYTETDHLQASFLKDLKHVLFLCFFSLFLRLTSFNPHYINTGWKDSFNAAVIKLIF